MSNCKVIALTNQKGGVGKTTTTMHLGIGLAREGKKVLLIDGDPQANLTMSLGFDHPDELTDNVCGILKNVINDRPYDPQDYIIPTEEGVDLVPSSIELSGLEVQLVSALSRETLLKDYINKVKENYDYILIDCQPSLGVLTINALVCADSVIIPTQAHYFSTKGLELLLRTISKVRQTLNPQLMIDGILMTMVNTRTNISREIISVVKETYGRFVPVFRAEIPYSVKIVEASTDGESIYQYKSDSKLAAAYEEFSKEVISIGEKQRWQDRTDSVR